MKRFLSTTVCIFSSISFKLLQLLHLTETEYKLQMELKSFNTYIFKMYKDAKGKKKKKLTLNLLIYPKYYNYHM